MYCIWIIILHFQIYCTPFLHAGCFIFLQIHVINKDTARVSNTVECSEWYYILNNWTPPLPYTFMDAFCTRFFGNWKMKVTRKDPFQKRKERNVHQFFWSPTPMKTNHILLISSPRSIPGKERFPQIVALKRKVRQLRDTKIWCVIFAVRLRRTTYPSTKRYQIVCLIGLRCHIGAGSQIENWWRETSRPCEFLGSIGFILINGP